MGIMLSEGDKAPAFTGYDQDGKKVSLSMYKGRKLILFFYPADNTPACTTESCNLRDNYALLKKNGFEVVGVSPDKIESHKKFETKFSLPFRLIADPEHEVINSFGVWGEKQLYGRSYMGLLRTTFVIDEKGTIIKVFRRPKNKAHAEEILASAGWEDKSLIR